MYLFTQTFLLDFLRFHHGNRYVSVAVGDPGWNPMHIHLVPWYHVEGDGHSLAKWSPPPSGDQCHLVGGQGNRLVVTNVISSLIRLFYCIALT